MPVPDAHRIAALEAEASFRRDRVALYRARAHGSRPFSPARLRELEAEYRQAADRLAHAKRARQDSNL